MGFGKCLCAAGLPPAGGWDAVTLKPLTRVKPHGGGGGHERPHGVDAEGVGDGEGRPEAAEGVDELRRAPNLPARPARRLTPRAPRAVLQKGPKGFKRL